MIKGAKTIAEYVIRRWLQEEGFNMSYFKLTMAGNEAVIRDESGESLLLVYDPRSKTVYIKE